MPEDVVLTKYGFSQIVLEEICETAKKCEILRVKIFGSRARGDYHHASDVDLAVWGGNVSLFALTIDEVTSTLLKYDVVDMNKSMQNELKSAINSEGIIIYEKV